MHRRERAYLAAYLLVAGIEFMAVASLLLYAAILFAGVFAS